MVRQKASLAKLTRSRGNPTASPISSMSPTSPVARSSCTSPTSPDIQLSHIEPPRDDTQGDSTPLNPSQSSASTTELVDGPDNTIWHWVRVEKALEQVEQETKDLGYDGSKRWRYQKRRLREIQLADPSTAAAREAYVIPYRSPDHTEYELSGSSDDEHEESSPRRPYTTNWSDDPGTSTRGESSRQKLAQSSESSAHQSPTRLTSNDYGKASRRVSSSHRAQGSARPHPSSSHHHTDRYNSRHDDPSAAQLLKDDHTSIHAQAPSSCQAQAPTHWQQQRMRHYSTTSNRVPDVHPPRHGDPRARTTSYHQAHSPPPPQQRQRSKSRDTFGHSQPSAETFTESEEAVVRASSSHYPQPPRRAFESDQRPVQLHVPGSRPYHQHTTPYGGIDASRSSSNQPRHPSRVAYQPQASSSYGPQSSGPPSRPRISIPADNIPFSSRPHMQPRHGSDANSETLGSNPPVRHTQQVVGIQSQGGRQAASGSSSGPNSSSSPRSPTSPTRNFLARVLPGRSLREDKQQRRPAKKNSLSNLLQKVRSGDAG